MKMYYYVSDFGNQGMIYVHEDGSYVYLIDDCSIFTYREPIGTLLRTISTWIVEEIDLSNPIACTAVPVQQQSVYPRICIYCSGNILVQSVEEEESCIEKGNVDWIPVPLGFNEPKKCTCDFVSVILPYGCQCKGV